MLKRCSEEHTQHHTSVNSIAQESVQKSILNLPQVTFPLLWSLEMFPILIFKKTTHSHILDTKILFRSYSSQQI